MQVMKPGEFTATPLDRIELSGGRGGQGEEGMDPDPGTEGSRATFLDVETRDFDGRHNRSKSGVRSIQEGLAFGPAFGPNWLREVATYAADRVKPGCFCLEDDLRRPILYPLSYSRIVCETALSLMRTAAARMPGRTGGGLGPLDIIAG